jgi:hypothetical protein
MATSGFWELTLELVVKYLNNFQAPTERLSAVNIPETQ